MIKFFEEDGKNTHNDYLIAFLIPLRLITIRNGRRVTTQSKTHWIGDQAAFERFREYELLRNQYEKGVAIPSVLFADEIKGSPASDLYSIMRSLSRDKSVASVGGMISVISSRDIGFRFSVYSDMLFNWPSELEHSENPSLEDRFDLYGSGENESVSVNQISPGYYDFNLVAFYMLKGKLLFAVTGPNIDSPSCYLFRNVEPKEIGTVLDAAFNFQMNSLYLIASSAPEHISFNRAPSQGMSMAIKIEANTMPK